ncbi:DUF4303 domain-containing protein [Paenibacillus peoriae]|uniref:DUF4303 domain-containing protein n=1 Tax=Paenibacillus peoriae TaxID=59893 RepID=UPI003F962876
MKPTQGIEALAAEIADVARTSFRTLFENGERYYYCTLFTTGEGHAPSISAWSWEALERETARQGEESDTPGLTIAELIKFMPPDEINTEIALRLNRAESPDMQAWLVEAAE